ncbi:hypothetical protein [Priestia megaterium]|uniref:hypothetical protein n=1 Tax=Priestia megaterium TaxID=1404 RepID=UPI000BFE2E1D|nr:hypothetical protein [Priestia megaterium]PGK30365.1 hypothetical protein CN902_12555 [Priestia megaterium]UYT88820.1 hypothetical protein OHU75_26345 [Priestia megaterium]
MKKDEKDELAEQLGVGGTDVNAIRQAVVTQTFKDNVGERVFLLIGPYPFLVIGIIVDVLSDYVLVEAEITNVSELDDEEFRIHIDSIEVFYIEEEGKPIPDIRDVNL